MLFFCSPHFDDSVLRKRERLEILVKKTDLSATYMQEARSLAAGQPPEHRAHYFRLLQYCSPYFSQRANESKENGNRIGDIMCNETSLAMCLAGLAIPQRTGKAFPDELEDVRLQNGYAPRTHSEALMKLAKFYGARVEFVGRPDQLKRDSAWFNQNLLPKLSSGSTALTSIIGHIVWIIAVTDAGLVVDDPYGKSTLKVGCGSGLYSFNPANQKFVPDTQGHFRVWDWNLVGKHCTNYVMLLSPSEANVMYFSTRTFMPEFVPKEIIPNVIDAAIPDPAKG